MNTKQNTKGFTIIEVVLVLAIAGLIFLMVFVALPALQRGQRDTSRKNDMSRAMTAITNYSTNNRGKMPTLDTAFINSYIKVNGDTFTDPDGTDYVFKANATKDGFTPPAASPYAHDVYYTLGATCDGESTKADSGTRKIAIQYKLEGGGVACNNN